MSLQLEDQGLFQHVWMLFWYCAHKDWHHLEKMARIAWLPGCNWSHCNEELISLCTSPATIQLQSTILKDQQWIQAQILPGANYWTPVLALVTCPVFKHRLLVLKTFRFVMYYSELMSFDSSSNNCPPLCS